MPHGMSISRKSSSRADCSCAIPQSGGQSSNEPRTIDVYKRQGGTSYGEPIDEEFSGDSTSVYAVAGGEVTSVGENEEIGKYIKITHGEKGESLYGNLSTTGVKVPSRVKKGQIIGTYEKSDEKQFYYSFREFE